MHKHRMVGPISRLWKRRVLAAFLTLVALLQGAAELWAGEAPRLLICAEVHGPDYPTTRGLIHMTERVRARTGGKIEIRIYHSAQLGSERTTIEMAQAGTLDLTRVNGAPMGEFNPEIGVLSMPYLFRDDEHRWQVLDGPIGRSLLDGLEKSGMVGLCYYDSGSRSFYNNRRPIHKPEDMAGLRIRLQDSQLFMDMVQLLGAYPTVLPFEEVFRALHIGIIDGAENNASSYFTTRHHELAPYYSLDRHSSVPEVLIISKKTWDTLTAAERRILREAAQESKTLQQRLWAEKEADSMKQVISSGCRVNQVDIAAFRRAVQPLYDKYGGRYRNLIAAIRAAQ